jgi:hypothetical protein
MNTFEIIVAVWAAIALLALLFVRGASSSAGAAMDSLSDDPTAEHAHG